MVNETLYSIIFLDNERNPIPNCYFELTINGHVITGQANNYGEVQFNRQLVESTQTEYKELNLTFWNEKFPKTEHSTTDSFVWPEGKTSIKALMPDTYIINTRSILNEDDEPQEYQRAYYLVRKGDTWSGLEAKLGINKVEALMFYNRMSYSDQLVEGAKLYYPLGFRTKKEKTEKGEKTNSSSTKQQRSQENGKPIEVASKRGECFCYRDFTVKEIKKIIYQLRDFEPNVKRTLGYSLFSAKNCNIPNSETTYENFTKELNIAMKKYDIDTCLRKIHFLAQCYHESAHFSTSQELGSLEYLRGKSYYPYIGRGLIQLTHSGERIGEIGYKQYFEYIGKNNYKTDYSLLNRDLHFAVDASGYFWKRGKLLSAGNLLGARYPNSRGVKVNYQKTKISTHTTIDINLVADDDNIYQVTFLINGGLNGIKERISYVNELKRAFNYEINHINK